MKNIGINEPCSENWNEMSKNEKGAFCQKCASQVHDFTNKSSLEIKQTLVSLLGQPVCGRITSSQEMELNADFNRWMNRQNTKSFQSQILFALLIVFGLGLFSCESEQDAKKIKDVQTSVASILEEENKVEVTKEKISESPISKVENITKQEAHLVGMMEMEERVPVEVVCTKDLNLDRGYAGGMSYTREYEDYLIEEVEIPVETQEFDSNGELIPQSFNAKVFPNPASEQTTFEMAIPNKGFFEIQLFDLQGKMLQTLATNEIDRGKFRKQINLQQYPSGTYLIVINSGKYKETVKFVKI